MVSNSTIASENNPIMTKTVVVLGGSYAGLGVTHRLLQDTIRRMEDARVILVSKNTHLYWNLASVRAVVPDALRHGKLFQPIEQGLCRYPPDSVEFIVGEAVRMDPVAKTVVVWRTEQNAETELVYDYLVLATGARCAATAAEGGGEGGKEGGGILPWKSEGTYQETIAALRTTMERVREARHIVVSGAGATGVELACEIRHGCRDKEVVLLCPDEHVLGEDSIAPAAERELRRLGVELRTNTRSTGVTTIDATTMTAEAAEEKEYTEDVGTWGRRKRRKGGEPTTTQCRRARVTLSDGDTIETDLFLPTTGLVPNTAYLPPRLLSEAGYVPIDDDMRVVAGGDGVVHDGIWALGDVVSAPRASYTITEAQARVVARSIGRALQGNAKARSSTLVNGGGGGGGGGGGDDLFFCATGPSRGVGRLGSWEIPVPSWLVWYSKGRTLGTKRAKKYVRGTM